MAGASAWELLGGRGKGQGVGQQQGAWQGAGLSSRRPVGVAAVGQYWGGEEGSFQGGGGDDLGAVRNVRMAVQEVQMGAANKITIHIPQS